ncbi:MAG: hypothetical protein ACXWL9_10650, partial [Syntrophales bacterium]
MKGSTAMEGLSGSGNAIFSVEATLTEAGRKWSFQIAIAATPAITTIIVTRTTQNCRLCPTVLCFFIGGAGAAGISAGDWTASISGMLSTFPLRLERN